MTLSALLDQAVGRWPARTALVYGSRTLTYQELDERVGRVTGGLAARGLRKGDRVVVIMSNRPEFFEVFFAVTRLGGIVVPVNPKLHPREWAYMISHSGGRIVVLDDAALRALSASDVRVNGVDHVVAVEADGERSQQSSGDIEAYRELAVSPWSDQREPVDGSDVAWMFYTSGTTGRPKGACIKTSNLLFMTDQYFERVYRPAGDKTVLHIGPLTHGSGLWSLPLVKGGATQVMMTAPSFDPAEALRLVERYGVQKIVFVSPTVIYMLTEAAIDGDFDLASLEMIGYGGSPISRPALKRAISVFGPVFCQIYGQGECPMTISTLLPADHDYEEGSVSDERLSSAGRGVLGNEVRALTDDGRVLPPDTIGEIAVRGPGVMAGYWSDPAATEAVFQHGWYRTGDLGSIDPDGFVFLRDRKKELVISGGSNIYPREVEDVLAEHPGVKEVAVFGVPDPFWGESVMAVVAHGDDPAPAESELLDLCRARLASYKKPRYFRYVRDLPRNSLGKVLKRDLKQHFSAEIESADIGRAPLA